MMRIRQFQTISVNQLSVLAIGLSLSILFSTPTNAATGDFWQDNCFIKTLYHNRTVRDRTLIIGGTAVAVSIMAYAAYKALTRSDVEKNLMALQSIELCVRKQYWHRVKTEEIDVAVPMMPAFKLLLDAYRKNAAQLTLLTPSEKIQLHTHLIAVGTVIHNPRLSKKEVATACEEIFFGFITELRERIVAQQEEADSQRSKVQKAQK